MIAGYRKELGIAPRKIADDEIVERCVLALVNEGARILEEGIAQRASDIDMVYLTGYGFPLYRGGPMLYADMLGLVQRRAQHGAPGDQCARRSGVLAAGAAAGQARGGRQDVQRLTALNATRREHSIMTDAVIVSTARTGLAKSWRGAFNMTHGATLGRSRRQARDRAREARPGRGRRRPDGLRVSRRRDRLQYRTADRAARGLPVSVPGMTINRFCSSGLQTIAMAAQRVIGGRGRDLRRRRRRIDIVRAERVEQAHAARDMAAGTQARDLLDHAGNRGERLQALRASRARSRTSTARRASSALQPPRQREDSTPRSCR